MAGRRTVTWPKGSCSGSTRVMRKALLAAGLVGTVLVSLNQGDVWLSGYVTRRVLVKSLLTPIIPFCVTMLGAFFNSGPGRCGAKTSEESEQ